MHEASGWFRPRLARARRHVAEVGLPVPWVPVPISPGHLAVRRRLFLFIDFGFSASLRFASRTRRGSARGACGGAAAHRSMGVTVAARGGCGGGGAVRCREWGPPLRGGGRGQNARTVARCFCLLILGILSYLMKREGYHENRPRVYPYFSNDVAGAAEAEIATRISRTLSRASPRAAVAAADMSAAATSRVAVLRGGVLPTGRRSAQPRRNGTTRPGRSATIVTARLGRASLQLQ